MQLIGYYSGGWSPILIGTAEVIVFAWFYGKIRVNITMIYYVHSWSCGRVSDL